MERRSFNLSFGSSRITFASKREEDLIYNNLKGMNCGSSSPREKKIFAKHSKRTPKLMNFLLAHLINIHTKNLLKQHSQISLSWPSVKWKSDWNVFNGNFTNSSFSHAKLFLAHHQEILFVFVLIIPEMEKLLAGFFMS